MQHDNLCFDHVVRALNIYRNIAACHAYLAHGDDAYARAAALMLPCYRTAFESLAAQMSGAEERELISGLRSAVQPAS